MGCFLVGAISPEAMHIVEMYRDMHFPDYDITPLKPAGLLSQVKSYGMRPDCGLVLLDDAAYAKLQGKDAFKDLLGQQKCHRYTTDDELEQYMTARFGSLSDDFNANTGTIPPDKLMASDSLSAVSDTDTYSITGYDSGDNYEEVQKLKDKIASQETLIRSLEAQVSDNASDDSDTVKELTGVIRNLKEELEEANNARITQDDKNKIAKLEEVTAQLQNAKDELKESKLAKADSDFNLSKTKEELESVKARLKELEDSDAKASSYSEGLEKSKSEVTSLKVAISELNDKLHQATVDLSSANAEIEELKNQLKQTDDNGAAVVKLNSELQEKNQKMIALESDVSARQEEIDSLRKQLKDIEDKIAEGESAAEGYKSANDQLIEQLEQLRNEVNTLHEEGLKKDSELRSKEEELTEYCKTDIESKKTIEILQEEMEKLEKSNEELTGIQEQFEDQKNLVQMLSRSLEETKAELTAKKTESKTQGDQIIELEAQVEANKAAYDKSLADISTLSNKLQVTEEKSSLLQNQLNTVEEKFETLQAESSTLKDENIKLSSENKKLTAQLSSANNSIIEQTAQDEEMNRLESELRDEKRTTARLKAEVEVLRKNSDVNNSADLRMEIARLNGELADAKSKAESKVSVEVESLKERISELSTRCTDLEMDLSTKVAELEERKTSVFSRLADLTIPKVVFDASLPPLTIQSSKLVCMMTGSSESSSSLYNVIRKSAAADQQRHIILLDLTIDSKVDSSLHVQKCVSPIDWLTGNAPFNQFLGNTMLPNVKVIAIGLSYINELFLLDVDWSKRLQELSNAADTVIINIGCVTDIVTKVLFNTFSQSMKTYVITFATPQNLRTTILGMTGFKNISSNVTVCCTDFDARLSGDFYQRLSKKFKSQIFQSSDVIKFS